jgi:hypothetical protein
MGPTFDQDLHLGSDRSVLDISTEHSPGGYGWVRMLLEKSLKLTVKINPAERNCFTDLFVPPNFNPHETNDVPA